MFISLVYLPQCLQQQKNVIVWKNGSIYLAPVINNFISNPPFFSLICSFEYPIKCLFCTLQTEQFRTIQAILRVRKIKKKLSVQM